MQAPAQTTTVAQRPIGPSPVQPSRTGPSGDRVGPVRTAPERPALQRIHDYLTGLKAYLQARRPAVRLVYAVPGFGNLQTQEQSGYRFFQTPSNAPGSFGFRFERTGDACLTARADLATSAARACRLRGVGLTPIVLPSAGAGALTVVSARVSVELRFEHDPDTDRLIVQALNLDGLGLRRFSLCPRRLDVATLSALARTILGHPGAARALALRGTRATAMEPMCPRPNTTVTQMRPPRARGALAVATP